MRRRLFCAIGVTGIDSGRLGKPGMGIARTPADHRTAAIDAPCAETKP